MKTYKVTLNGKEQLYNDYDGLVRIVGTDKSYTPEQFQAGLQKMRAMGAKIETQENALAPWIAELTV